MSKLFRPKVVRYVLPDGKYVPKGTPGAVRRVEQVQKWYGRYTDADGRQVKVPLSESKDTAKRMLAKILGDEQLARVGIVDPFAAERRRPLAEHLEDYRRYLLAKGDTEPHVNKTLSQCRAVIDGCRFLYADDLQPSAVVEFIAALGSGPLPELPAGRELFTSREVADLLGVRVDSVWRMLHKGNLTTSGDGRGRGRSFTREDVLTALERRRTVGVETRNHYLRSVRSFSKWLVKDRRTGTDPLAHLSRQNPETDRRHPRRALREDAFAKLVEATAAGPRFRGIGGPDRLILYTLAANTGFRASELGSLTPRSFSLDASPPTVTVEAAYSKHRRRDVQPLRPDVAELLRKYLAGRRADRRVWPGTWTGAAAEMLRLDLEAAGIPYQDEQGRYFDFHALRGQFISFMAAGGVHPKVAQVLARHSTITLTMDYYTHLDVFDVSGALDKLPGVKAAPAAPAEGDKAAG